MWLLKLQYVISEKYGDRTLQGTSQDFDNLKSFVDAGIRTLCDHGDISRSEVSTEIRTDEGKTVLFIRRNGKVVQTYYIE